MNRPVHISTVEASVETARRRVFGPPATAPVPSQALTDIRRGYAARLQQERNARDSAALLAHASHLILPNGRAIYNDGTQISQPPPAEAARLLDGAAQDYADREAADYEAELAAWTAEARAAEAKTKVEEDG